jgi:hypothetical protein
MSASLTDRVRTVAERLESDQTLQQMDVLEHTYDVTDDGRVTEVRAVLTVGGPHIEVECLAGVVVGHWSGESHRYGIESESVSAYGQERAERMESRID